LTDLQADFVLIGLEAINRQDSQRMGINALPAGGTLANSLTMQMSAATFADAYSGTNLSFYDEGQSWADGELKGAQIRYGNQTRTIMNNSYNFGTLNYDLEIDRSWNATVYPQMDETCIILHGDNGRLDEVLRHAVDPTALDGWLTPITNNTEAIRRALVTWSGSLLSPLDPSTDGSHVTVYAFASDWNSADYETFPETFNGSMMTINGQARTIVSAVYNAGDSSLTFTVDSPYLGQIISDGTAVFICSIVTPKRNSLFQTIATVPGVEGANVLHFHVMDQDNNPVPDAVVTISQGAQRAAKPVDVTGQVDFGVTSGEWAYAVAAPGFIGTTGSITVEVDESRDVNLDPSVAPIVPPSSEVVVSP
jgi:hypothetical protein